MSSAWAGGTDAIIERMDKMTALYIEEARKSIYTGESAVNCEECGEPIPEARRKIDRIALFRAKAGLRMRPDNSYVLENASTSMPSFWMASALRWFSRKASMAQRPTWAWACSSSA